MPIVLPVSHLPSACTFFLAALHPLGYRYLYGRGGRIGLGVHRAEFFIEQSDHPRGVKPNHIRFHATSRAAVRDFYTEALYAGAKRREPPGDRAAAGDGGDVFNTVVIDREGNSIEVSFADSAPAPAAAAAAAAAPEEDWESDVDRSAVRAWQRNVAESSARSTVSSSSSSHAGARGGPTPSAAVDNDDTRSHASARQSRAVTRTTGAASARSRSSAARTDITPSRASRTNAAGDVVNMPELVRSLSGTVGTLLARPDAALAGSVPKKTVAGTVLGAAAGAAFAYAMCASEEEGGTRREQWRYVKWPGGEQYHVDGGNSSAVGRLPAAMQHLAIQAPPGPPGPPPPPSAFATRRAGARSEVGAASSSRRRSSSLSSRHSLGAGGSRHRQQPGSSRSSVTLVPDDAPATLLLTKKRVESPAPPPTEIELDLDAITVAPSDSISCAGSKYARSGMRRSSRSSGERLDRAPVSARRASRGVY